MPEVHVPAQAAPINVPSVTPVKQPASGWALFAMFLLGGVIFVALIVWLSVAWTDSWEEDYIELSAPDTGQLDTIDRQMDGIDAYNQRVEQHNQRVFEQNQRAIEQNEYWQRRLDDQMNQFLGPTSDPFRHQLPPSR